MNFGLYDMLKRFKTFKHDWEVPYLANSDDRVFKNTFKDIAHILQSCSDNETRFEIECYDIGHLYTAAHFIDRGLIKAPFLIQSVFGILGGIGPHPDDVMHMKRTADRLFGDAYVWSVLGAGRNQIPIATQSAAMGAMCGLDWKTLYGTALANWPNRMQTKSRAFAKSSKAFIRSRYTRRST
jgi:uncharacterized protein (DUF849 family)